MCLCKHLRQEMGSAGSEFWTDWMQLDKPTTNHLKCHVCRSASHRIEPVTLDSWL